MTMGRDPRCDFVLHDPIASRRHCQLVMKNGSLMLESLGGRTPVLVNGSPTDETVLVPGDELAIGTDRFLLVGMPEQAAANIGHAEPGETCSWGEGGRVSLRVDSAEPANEAKPATVYDLALLHSISRELAFSDTVSDLFASLRNCLTSRFRPSGIWIALVHGDDDLTFIHPGEAAAGPGQDEAPDDAVLDYARTALQQGEGLLMPHRCGKPGRQRIEFTMASPVQLRGKNLAVVLVQTATPAGSYDEEDLRFLVLLTQSVGPLLHATADLDRLRRTNEHLRMESADSLELVGESPAMVRVREQVREAAGQNCNVLVTGETGTGKELVARLIHMGSSRSERPMIVVNCAAIPRELFAGAVFGHEKGAYTGAVRRSPGFLAQAHGGVLFLDEVGELTIENQAALLRVIETGTYRRIGAERERKVDARIVAATNKDVQASINDGTLRSDLYHRLNEFEVHLSPLRDRLSDVPVLAQHFFDVGKGLAKRPLEGFSAAALARLSSHDWPGNARELRNRVRRAIQAARQPLIEPGDLFEAVTASSAIAAAAPPVSFREAERNHLVSVLEHCKGNIRQAARMLGISRSTLYRKMAAHQLEPDEPAGG